MACGLAPTGIGAPARRVVRSIGVTVADAEFTTNAVGCRVPPAAAAAPGETAAGLAAPAARAPAARAPVGRAPVGRALEGRAARRVVAGAGGAGWCPNASLAGCA